MYRKVFLSTEYQERLHDNSGGVGDQVEICTFRNPKLDDIVSLHGPAKNSTVCHSLP